MRSYVDQLFGQVPHGFNLCSVVFQGLRADRDTLHERARGRKQTRSEGTSHSNTPNTNRFKQIIKDYLQKFHLDLWLIHNFIKKVISCFLLPSVLSSTQGPAMELIMSSGVGSECVNQEAGSH